MRNSARGSLKSKANGFFLGVLLDEREGGAVSRPAEASRERIISNKGRQ